MKKFLALMMTLMMICIPALADDAIEVFVTITDAERAFALTYAPVSVTDTDGDGVLTIADVLYCAHEQKHPDGAAAFGTELTEYGISMTRLWGIENGGAYGYCHNDASAWSMADPVVAGDHVKAYVYTDTTTWSDAYCFFQAASVTAEAGAEIALTLSMAGYDESYNPITLPVAGAVITVDGEAIEAVTDENGCAVITVAAGAHVVSAVSDTQTLVPPVLLVNAAE